MAKQRHGCCPPTKAIFSHLLQLTALVLQFAGEYAIYLPAFLYLASVRWESATMAAAVEQLNIESLSRR